MLRFMVLGLAFLSLTSSARAELAACSCGDFDKLQQELDNAMELRDRHARRAAQMEQDLKAGKSRDAVAKEYRDWETGKVSSGKGAADGIVAVAPAKGGKGVEAIQYTPAGVHLINPDNVLSEYKSWVKVDGAEVLRFDPQKACATEEKYRKAGHNLCEFANRAEVERSAESTSLCKEIKDILVRHEESHRATCNQMGYFDFVQRSPVDLALDEVKAYDQQIADLRKLLGKVLQGAEVQFEDKSHITYTGQMFNFQYTFTTEPVKSKIPEHDGQGWSASLKGVHRTRSDKITMAGMACTMTPITRDVHLGLKADGKTATVTFEKFGPAGAIGMKCPGGGAMGGGMNPDPSGETVQMPLKLSSSHTEDVSKSKLATMMAGVAKVSGASEAKLQIICPAQKQ